jgi:hypothetical protein
VSYYIRYHFEDESREPEDGIDVATGKGLVGWGDWVEGVQDRFPEVWHLIEEGWWGDDDGNFTPIEAELQALLALKAPNKDVRTVTSRVLKGVQKLPAGTLLVVITDGVEHDDEDDEDEDE